MFFVHRIYDLAWCKGIAEAVNKSNGFQAFTERNCVQIVRKALEAGNKAER